MSKAVGLLNDAQTPLLAAIRLFWGWQFTMTGWGKLHHLDHVTEFFATLNLPMPGTTAIFVAMVEFLGGVFLALGLGTRVVALILFVNMSVAFWTADREALMSFFAAPEKFYGADPFPFWAVALLLAAFGPGRWAADRWLIPYVQGVEKA
ncbi:MAG TPA: DoxX family protein [Terracidiphilus sp.]|nr:DoxX family protein [Terracidiphilus sp.]